MKKHLLTISLFLTSLLCQAQYPALFGLTEAGGINKTGTIFSYSLTKDSGVKDYDFGPFSDAGSDGRMPLGSLIRASNGLLYGMTVYGGAYNGGIIFSYDLTTHKETDMYDFGSGEDGYDPFASLVQASDGLLYGTTAYGGEANAGIIFSYNISTGKETDVHDFGNSTSTEDLPFGSLTQATDGLLYGMADEGGTYNEGAIFSYDITTGIETDVHDFGKPYEGKEPSGSLIQASNGLLYGMTAAGGVNDQGTIFSYNISNDSEIKLYDFGISDTDGIFPEASLLQANNGLLYSMTETGGHNNGGMIFSYDISTDSYVNLYSFSDPTNYFNGHNPIGSLIQGSNGLLYGTGSTGGTYNGGIIFSYDLSSNTETDIFNLGNDTGGTDPNGDLIEVDSPFTTNIKPIANAASEIYLYPNPSSTNIHLSLNLQNEQPVTLSLYNTMGQQVWAEDLGNTKDINTIIPLTNLANGVYILKINSGGESEQKEVVVTR